jgi:oligopeptide/dipeptide ABC transporter ATP-binding protein
MTGERILEVHDLRTYFELDEGTLKAVDGVSFSLNTQKTLGIIGESGCGKSVTAQSVMRIVPPPGRIATGRILLHPGTAEEVDLAALGDMSAKMRSIRGRTISMVFQEPMTSLSPVHSIGFQMTEAILLHRTPDKAEARDIAIDMLDRVGIANPAQRFDEYAYQLSGGMRQRAMIAMALSCDPDILIADEPTTALDVTIQAQILELLKELQDQFGMAVLFSTHDLGVIAEISEEVAVMYLGKIVEKGSAVQVFKNPLHPYTRKLLKSIPAVDRKAEEYLEVIEGTVPMPLNPPQMCGFYSRCPSRMPGTCDEFVPALVELEPGHSVRCFLHSDQKDEVNVESKQPTTAK